MTQIDPAGARRRMVQRLRQQGIKDPRVLDAIGRVPREMFLPESWRGRAYEDGRFPIGEGQSISQPWTVAKMSELLQVNPGERVLEIGTGSGYQAAVLGAMGLIVYSMERHASLARQAGALLRELGLISVTVKQFDGTYGWAALAPYRGVIVTAAGPTIPPTLIEQLDLGGRLVMPLAGANEQRLIVVQKGEDGSLQQQDHGAASFVPLIGRFGYREGA